MHTKPIDNFINALEKSNCKITFGLQPKQIEVIEKHLKKFEGAKYSYDVWKDIGKEIGWDSLIAALYYFQKEAKAAINKATL